MMFPTHSGVGRKIDDGLRTHPAVFVVFVDDDDDVHFGICSNEYVPSGR